MTVEPEPTGWELMRAIQGIRGDVGAAMQNMVTQAMLAVYQEAQRTTDARQDARIRAVEVAQEKRREEREREQAEARKTRSQQNFAITMAAITAALGLGSALILRLVGA